jgi:glycosyltransferase involved in cell wall biosynthesis
MTTASQAPLVSVVMPAFNDERFIGEALRSALDQTYPHVEVVVVDDGSTDATTRVAESFGERVRVLRQSNAGAAVARTLGMHAARGELIAFLDADDYWHRDKLALQVAHLAAHSDLGAVYCAWLDWIWPDDADPEAVLARAPRPLPAETAIDPLESGWLYTDLLLDCVIHTSAVVLRREVVARVGDFDTTLRKGQDLDYWLRCSRVTRFDKLARPLSLYRRRSDSITTRVAEVNYGARIIDRALARWGARGPDGRRPDMTRLARARAKLWSSFGAAHLQANRPRTALVSALRGLRCWPVDVPSAKLATRALAACVLGTRTPPGP